MVAITRITLGFVLCLWGTVAVAAEVTVAVAANFVTTARALAEDFTQRSGHKVRLAHGATGSLTAQIERGAPFDVFLAADAERPARLAEMGLAGPPQTYALGQLALAWRGEPTAIADIRSIAVADAKLAPYGVAAEEVLVTWDETPRKLTGENVAQALTFVVTGNADAGLVALAQVQDPRFMGSFQAISPELYSPIRQDAVLLDRGADNPAALAWMEYLLSSEGQAIIAAAGYALDVGE